MDQQGLETSGQETSGQVAESQSQGQRAGRLTRVRVRNQLGLETSRQVAESSGQGLYAATFTQIGIKVGWRHIDKLEQTAGESFMLHRTVEQ